MESYNQDIAALPAQVEAILQDFAGLSPDYQLIISGKGDMDKVELKVELEHSFYRGLSPEPQGDQPAAHELLQRILENLRKKIKDVTGLSMAVTILSPGTIPRGEGGKLNHIVDQRKK